jgi:hypothetical protein
MLSVFEEPVSLAGSRSGTEGVGGAVVSIMMLNAPDATETLPAPSVAVAVMLWRP